MKRYLIILLIFIVSPLFGATYYVENKGSSALNTTDEGSTSWTNATNILTPTSAETSMVRALAGDIVLFRSGTYQLGVNIRDNWQSIIQPSNSGTSGNVITFKNYTGETVTLNGTGTYTPAFEETVSNPIGIYRQDYVTLDGFAITSDSGSSAAQCVVAYHSLGSFTVGNIVKNCDIYGGDTPNGNGQTNIQGVRLEDTDGTIIEYNTIYGYNGISNNHNTSAVKYYHNKNVILRNNEIYDSYIGMYDKSQGLGNTIENNYFHDIENAILITDSNFTDNDNGVIKNNLIVTDGSGIIITCTQTSDNWEISNNTIYKTGTVVAEDWAMALTPGDSNNIFNNLISHNIHIYASKIRTDFDSVDHNLFDDRSTTNILIKLHGQADPYWDEYTSLSAWQASGYLSVAWDAGCGSSANPGCLSSDSVPTFINTSGTMSTVADFALTAASAGYQADRSSNDMGVDVTNVGTGADPSPSETSSSIGTGTSSTFSTGDSTVIN